MFPWHQYLLAILFLLAGFNHFRKPKLYQRVMPNYIPYKSSMVLLTGILEMIFGFMLITNESQHIGAWGIIILLILFIPVHLFMLQNEQASLKLPKWVLVLRLPLQLVIMYWAFLYT
ncbi:MAG: DoxX family protein [Flavobacteriales bacterium]